jgi:hypothetical protein
MVDDGVDNSLVKPRYPEGGVTQTGKGHSELPETWSKVEGRWAKC